MRIHSTLPRIQADFTLLLVSIFWGSAFVAQRVAAQNMSIFLYNALRFLIGALVILPFFWRSLKGISRPDKRTLAGVFLAGVCMFGGTTLQQLGMRFTTASSAGFITGLYVVIVPILLGVGLRQAPRRSIWLASLLAAAGLYLLSTQGSFRLSTGDELVLAGSLLWALHVIMIGWLAGRLEIYPLAIGQYTVCGLLHVVAGIFFEGGGMFEREVVWLAVLYTSVFSIGLGFTLQAIGQQVAPPADAAIILSSEAGFAALFGWLILDEKLSAIQLTGCGLMLAGMLLAQLTPHRSQIPVESS